MISQDVERVLLEIDVKYYFNNKKTRDLIIDIFRLKLDPSIIIKCDNENNPIEVVESGKIFVRLDWLENYIHYYCNSTLDTMTKSEYRDIQIKKILN